MMKAEPPAKTIVRNYYAAINNGNLRMLDTFVVLDYVHHIPNLPPGLAIYKHFLAMYRASFSDLHTTIEDLLLDGDKVIAYVTVRGTHTDTFLGHPPTGKMFMTIA